MSAPRCVWDCSVAINVSQKKTIKAGLHHVLKVPYNLLKLVCYLFLRKRVDKCIASANARQSVLLCWQFSDLKLLHLKNRLHCFLFRVRSVSCSQFTFCSRDFYVATFQSGLANQKPCNVSHRIGPAGLWRTCHGKITVSHHLTQPTTILLHLFHGALTFLIRKLGRFHHELFLSTNAILSSLLPLRDFRTSRILASSLSSRVSKMCWKFTLPCSSFNSKFSCLVLVALGHDIAGTPHQLSHYIFILQEKFFPPSDKPEGMIFQPISKPISVEPQDDKVLYFAVGELLTTPASILQQSHATITTNHQRYSGG